MGNSEQEFKGGKTRYLIVGPGEYYVPRILMTTFDKEEANTRFDKLLASAPRMDQEGLRQVPYALYEETTTQLRQLELSNEDMPNA